MLIIIRVSILVFKFNVYFDYGYMNLREKKFKGKYTGLVKFEVESSQRSWNSSDFYVKKLTFSYYLKKSMQVNKAWCLKYNTL